MSEADKGGILRRVKSGWWIGLSQFDPVIWLETLLIALLLASTLYSGGPGKPRFVQTPVRPAAPVASAAARPAVATAPSVAKPVAQRAWTGPRLAQLRTRPSATAGGRKLPAYTPLQVSGRAGSDWLEVQAVFLSGEHARGYLPRGDVQFDNPVAAARPERGALTVIRNKGALMYAAPSALAANAGTRMEKGRRLRMLGRLRRSDAPGATEDFLLVENDRPARNAPRQFWLAASDVRVDSSTRSSAGTRLRAGSRRPAVRRAAEPT